MSALEILAVWCAISPLAGALIGHALHAGSAR